MMNYIYLFFFAILGLIFGSFLSVLTYRVPRNISYIRGRSFCPKCKKKIAWFDNFPLVSYLLLSGKCRNCQKPISRRYPIIELTSAIGFMAVFSLIQNCPNFNSSLFCAWNRDLGIWSIPLFLTLFLVFLAIFIIDLEQQIIPDSFVFFGFFLVVVLLLLVGHNFFSYLFTGFLCAVLILMVHLVTRGRGMGLGDVKLALFGGVFLGWPQAIIWLFLSFLVGAVTGIFLILAGKAKLKTRVAFGPFLVISFFVVLIFGNNLTKVLFGIW